MYEIESLPESKAITGKKIPGLFFLSGGRMLQYLRYFMFYWLYVLFLFFVLLDIFLLSLFWRFARTGCFWSVSAHIACI